MQGNSLDTIVQHFSDAHEGVDDDRIVDVRRRLHFVVQAKQFVFLENVLAHINLDGLLLEQIDRWQKVVLKVIESLKKKL